ncbi:antitoxin [Streptomyces hazeniae]|uniref:antitoxin n=1 Tax=Streptomyces hazeniae TaxID=3075538 RepID=UPI00374E1FA0
MSMMNKIKSMLKGHESKAAKGIDVAGDLIDRKTHGKYRRHVDKAQSRLKQELGRPGTHGGTQGGPHGGTQSDPRGGHDRPGGPGGDPYGDQGRPPGR